MGSTPIIREKCLLVKEKWAIELTAFRTSANVRLYVVGRVPMNPMPFARQSNVTAVVSFAWWYWGPSEEAPALA
jgi:hypothetical protein